MRVELRDKNKRKSIVHGCSAASALLMPRNGRDFPGTPCCFPLGSKPRVSPNFACLTPTPSTLFLLKRLFRLHPPPISKLQPPYSRASLPRHPRFHSPRLGTDTGDDVREKSTPHDAPYRPQWTVPSRCVSCGPCAHRAGSGRISPPPGLISCDHADSLQTWQLAGAVHDVLEAKERLVRYVHVTCDDGWRLAWDKHWHRSNGSEYQEQHGVVLRGLYRLLKRKRGPDGDYADVTMDLDELEPGADEAYNEWKEAYALEAGPSRIAGLEIPPIPPPSPPAGTIDFPDEPPVQAAQPPHPEPVAVPELRRSSRPSSRAASRHGTPAANSPRPRGSRPASPRPPPATVALNDVLPRRDISLGAFGSEIEAPPWEPADNYRPADEPLPMQAAKVLMPLESDYSTNVPKLPPIPHASTSRHRRGSKNEGKPDSFKLSLMYGLNPLSGGMTRSPKVVLTADWRVAQAEMRHIRAMERIEAKKAAGRWSLRQPKKHRGPPVPKGHWDFLLDEMVSGPFRKSHG